MITEGTALLDELTMTFRRFLSLPPGAAEAMALWVCFTHTFEAQDVAPRLALLSPVPGCGKTTALRLLHRLCANPQLLSNITAAAVYRFIEESKQTPPTLLMDEIGTYAGSNDDLRGILNSGHTKDGAIVIRSGGKDRNYKVERFSTWAPIAMAKIGSLPSEWASRSIIIPLQRKRRDETLDRLRRRDDDVLKDLSKRVAEWAKTVLDQLRDPDPTMPAVLSNRTADNWRPLFAITDAAGGDWPLKAREIAIQLSGDSGVSEEEALLAAIAEALRGDSSDRFSSEQLCKLLEAGSEDRFGSIGPPRLARLLKPFGIRPKSVRIEGRALKGYMRSSFEDALNRYVPSTPATAATPGQPNDANDLSNGRPATDGQRDATD